MAQKDPRRDPVADLARLKDTNDRAIALTEALLLLSRAGNTIAEPEIVDLSLLADEAVETLLPLAEKHGVFLTIDGSSADVVGASPRWRDDCTRRVSSLIENGGAPPEYPTV